MSPPRLFTAAYTDLAALAAYTVLLILRAPQIWRGRFWAEEGTVFFSAASSSGLLESLFRPQLGYYAAVASFATTLAARTVPLEQAPLVTTLIAAAVQLLPAALLVSSRIDALPDSRSRAIALALLLFALPSEEIWLNTANSSHYLAVAAGIILVARPEASRTRCLHLGLLVLAGLSGVDANLLAPFFWLRAYQERSRERLEQAAVLSACAVIQALIVLLGPALGFAPAGLDGPRTPRLDFQLLAHAILAKDILLPFVGRAWTEQIMAPLAKSLAAHEPTSFAAVIVVAWAGLLAFAVIKSRRWQPRLLFCLGLYLVFVSFTASVEASRPDWQLTHASALGAGRYYYLPNVFLGLALLMAAGPGSALPVPLRRAALVLVVWMLAVGSNEFFRSDARPLFFTGTDWKRQVTAWRLGEIRELTIWPAPWKLAPGRDSSSSSVVTASSGLASAKTKIEVYTRSGCPHCAEARPFLQQLAAERSDLSIVEHDVARDGDALERLRVLSARAGIATPGVPTFVIGERVMVGFDAATTPARIRAALEETAAPEPPDSLELPLVGLVDVAGLGLPLFTALVGLVDGFNPCATWVLLFLLAMLANLRSRSRMALIAGTFVVVSGAVYFAFMAAWLTFFMVIGISQPVRILIAAVALFIGAVNVKDFFAMGRGSSLGISEAAKPGFYRRVREILHADDLAGAMLGIVTLAFLVNLIELLCTAGLPALYTAILTSQGLPSWQYYAYLALYIAAYMLDDAVLVTIGVATLGRRKLQERGGRWLKLLSGLVILALGALLLVRPGWMGF